MNKDMIRYYSERAAEYERIYTKPERQEDIKAAAELLKRLFYNKRVLEIACGTGFWTQHFGPAASSVLATDINESVIEVARSKGLPEHIAFETMDMYNDQNGKGFDALFGGFIFSHILKQDREQFMTRLGKLLKDDGTMVLMDNLYVEGSNHPIVEKDENDNTYQERKLDDGSVHKVLKNFPDEQELRDLTGNYAEEISYTRLKYFWILSFRLKK